jgi:ribosome biogenesis GTPase
MTTSPTREGLVVRSTAGFVDVVVDGKRVQARIRGRLKNKPHLTDLCVIGDRVRIEEPDESTRVVVEVLPRRSRFSRRQPGRGPMREDVLIANLDALFVTFCRGEPPLKRRLLDRFLVIAEQQGVQAIIVVNKADLAPAEELPWRPLYESLGYEVLEVSAEDGTGMSELRHALEGRISAFVGPSGVGKSSLINRVLPELDLETAAVSEHHGKGRHTTRVATLHALPSGGFIADTPGIRELGTWALPEDELDLCFPELRALREQCSFRRCSHVHEPGCAVIHALEEGKIDAERYESYVRLREETS